MPDSRTHRTVAERLELQLDRYPDPLRRQRRRVTLVAGLLPLLWLGYYAGRGDHTLFLSRPVAESHQSFQSECGECHREPWLPLRRLASTDSSVRSVRDEDCGRCHDQRKDDHHVLAMSKGVPDCAECHLEHRAARRLTDGADRTCVKCHEPYASHPELALLRRWPLEVSPTSSEALRRIELERLAALQPEVTSAGSQWGRWTDTTALKFSHAGHLSLQTSQLGRGARSAPLQCRDCHQLDTDGRYMQPIVYEQHCRACHPLRFSGKLNVAGVAEENDESHALPHENSEIVRGVILQRLIANAPDHLAERQAAGAANQTRLPNRNRQRAEARWEWVEAELRVLENAVFRLPAPDDGGTMPPSNVCLKCHEQAEGASGFAIEPPRIPARWLMAGRFRHDRHLNMQCVDCHHATSDGVPAHVLNREIGSTRVSDILLPSQAICHTCHGAESGAFDAFQPARQNCTECHQYHHVPLRTADDAAARR